MARIEITGMTEIRIEEMLKTYPREDVAELMARLGIAYDLSNAESLLTLAPGKTTGDWIRHEQEDPDGNYSLGSGYYVDDNDQPRPVGTGPSSC